MEGFLNCDSVGDLTDESAGQQENAEDSKEQTEIKPNEEASRDQTTILTNTTISSYSFLSPESMESMEDEPESTLEASQEVDEEEPTPSVKLDEQDSRKASSTNVSTLSSANELTESNESNTTNERPEVQETQSKPDNDFAAQSEQCEQSDAATGDREIAKLTNDLDIESIHLNGHQKESNEDGSAISGKEEQNLSEPKEAEEPKAAPVIARSWADLFKSGKSTKITMNVGLDHASTAGSLFSSDAFGPLGSIEKFVDDSTKLTRQIIEPAPIEEDPTFADFAKKLKELNLKHSLPLLIPCGLTNQSNWCYINAILQALLYCPPFYNCMREISEIDHIFRPKTATPVIDSFAKFFTHFMPDETLMRKAKQSNQFNFDDLPKREVYKPTCIYNVLGNINNECLNGKQEDAEEFLSSVLNVLHEEMLLLLNYDPKTAGQHQAKPKAIKAIAKLGEDQKSNGAQDSKWKEVKTKHKALVTTGVSSSKLI